MKVNNDKFNKWLEEEGRGVCFGNIGYFVGTGMAKVYVTKEWLIGLMTIWLLDNGYRIEKTICYAVLDNHAELSMSDDLFTALKDAIEVQDEQ